MTSTIANLVLATAVLGAFGSRAAFADPPTDPAQLYQQGQAAFDHQRYDDAVSAWEQSYALSHAPGLLYNIAQAYRLRGHPGDCDTARADYQHFAELTPPSPERDLALGYITELASCAATTPPMTAAPARDDHSLRTRELGVAAFGVTGTSFLIAGIALGAHAASLGDAVTRACSVSCNWNGERSTDAAGHRDAGLGAAFDVIGALALAGGAALYYFDVHDHGVSVAPTIREPGAVVTWSRAW